MVNVCFLPRQPLLSKTFTPLPYLEHEDGFVIREELLGLTHAREKEKEEEEDEDEDEDEDEEGWGSWELR